MERLHTENDLENFLLSSVGEASQLSLHLHLVQSGF